jgi:glycosyltransferase involved in cell wall biosynthesis
MTFHRHFCERDDFTTRVATDATDYNRPGSILFDVPRWWRRVRNSRLNRMFCGLELLHGQFLIPPRVIDAARSFQPDAVFTVAGSWDWTALAAQRVARSLRVPLIASFNDWFDYPWFRGSPSQRRAVENRFRCFYREADLAFCTSEGMREELGAHPNSHILYPLGEKAREMPPLVPDRTEPATILFCGNLGEWYGRMLEGLVRTAWRQASNLRFRIFGGAPSWSDEFEREARARGIYGGRVPFDELRDEAATSDILLLPMGFGENHALVERTSFKTKFLDYLAFGRPILVWGPSYCSAARTALEFDSAAVVSSPSEDDCLATLQVLAADPERKRRLVGNARKMYDDRFHPDRIHAGLLEKINALIATR